MLIYYVEKGIKPDSPYIWRSGVVVQSKDLFWAIKWTMRICRELIPEGLIGLLEGHDANSMNTGGLYILPEQMEPLLRAIRFAMVVETKPRHIFRMRRAVFELNALWDRWQYHYEIQYVENNNG